MLKKALSINYSSLNSSHGIQADLKTFLDLNVFGFTVITSNHSLETFKIPSAIIKKQLQTIFSGEEIQAVKIGSIDQATNIEIFKVFFTLNHTKNIVLDCTQLDFNLSLANHLKKELFPLINWLIINEDTLNYFFSQEQNLTQQLEKLSNLGPKKVMLISKKKLIIFNNHILQGQTTLSDNQFTQLSSTLTACLANGLSDKEILDYFIK